ncbi:hypothetical protein ANANG_G00165930 [Anguilla anguilla]|uniref:LIM zinc-binding domain-containing protein n=1 Tax=Anguilla anguilla TaxID=7936 RepID=A0A9D3M957_ANGAN|nr:hypothetical protein ANANG_G00165930 [Anguilla anguilla]
MRLMLFCCTWKDERMGDEEADGRLPVCSGCRLRIYDDQYLQALNADWHAVCFRCCECRASLSHWYYEKEGQLFCKRDYWARFGELCNGCTETISTGLIMRPSKHRPHIWVVLLKSGVSLALCGLWLALRIYRHLLSL